MTDLELLISAALAVGIVLDKALPGERSYQNCHARVWRSEKILFWSDSRRHPMCRPQSGGGNVEWNPLTDDGDALRLVVKLRLELLQMNLETDRDGITKESPVLRINSTAGWIYQYLDEDPGADTRRAITRAAAEIGRAAASLEAKP